MQDYLAIVLRTKFTLFYRFGEVTIPQGEFLSFSTEATKSEIDEKVLDMLKKITLVEYDTEVLILHLNSEHLKGKESSLKFKLSNLEAIYPLTEHARASISESIDSRIVLSQPIFETVWNSYEDWRLKQLHSKGAEILCRLCKLELSAEDYLNKIGLDALYEGLMSRGEQRKLKPGNCWAHLIAYDRHGYFPKETLGYFYDAGEAYAYSAGKETFEGSKLYHFLEGLSSSLRFNDILEQLTTSEQTQSYICKTSSENGLKWYEIAPLFFQLREDFTKVGREMSKSLLMVHTERLKKEFPDSFPFVVALLGLFLGYHNLYDIYYDSLGLRFYNDQPSNLTDVMKGSSSETELSQIAPPKKGYEAIIDMIKKNKKIGIKSIKKYCTKEGICFEECQEWLEKDEQISLENQSYVFYSSSLVKNQSNIYDLFPNG